MSLALDLFEHWFNIFNLVFNIYFVETVVEVHRADFSQTEAEDPLQVLQIS